MLGVAAAAVVRVVRAVVARRPELFLMLALALTCGIIARVADARIAAARQRERVMALRILNAEAERDSTRDVARENRDVAVLLSDSLRLVERRVIQVARERDAIDRALGAERQAKYAMAVQIDSLDRVVVDAGIADSGDGTRRATFNVRQPPYTVVADVALPLPPDSGRMAVRVSLDPVPITARVECSGSDSDVAQVATLALSSPRWATVRLDQLEQDARICSTAPRHEPGSRVGFAPVVLGMGAIVPPGLAPRWGWFLGVGLTVRR